MAEEDGRRDVAEQPEDDELEGQKLFSSVSLTLRQNKIECLSLASFSQASRTWNKGGAYLWGTHHSAILHR